MSTILKFIMAMLSLLTACESSAQGWTKLENLPEAEFTAIEVIDGTIYSASGTTLYTSDDQGVTWEESAFTDDEEVTVLCFAKFGNTIYAGTSDGVYSAPADNVHNVWNHDIFTLPVTSFAEREGTLYASVYGFGVMRLNGTAWMNFSTGLPTMSMNVARIMNVSGKLFAAAGGNGAFYTYDFGAAQWVEDFYFGTISAGFEVDDVVYANGSLYVSRENNLLRSDDGGENWVTDKTGLLEPANRFMYKGTENLYVFTNNEQNHTLLNYRPLEATGTTWADNAETLPWFTYDMVQSGDKLYLAASDGVYTNDVTMGSDDTAFGATYIYPNPSTGGRFILQTNLVIDQACIYDMAGRLVHSSDNITGAEHFELAQEGIYCIKLTAGNAVTTKKIIIKK